MKSKTMPDTAIIEKSSSCPSRFMTSTATCRIILLLMLWESLETGNKPVCSCNINVNRWLHSDHDDMQLKPIAAKSFAIKFHDRTPQGQQPVQRDIDSGIIVLLLDTNQRFEVSGWAGLSINQDGRAVSSHPSRVPVNLCARCVLSFWYTPAWALHKMKFPY